MLHKTISGGGEYLGFARSRLERLKATGLRFVEQRFVVNNVYIRVAIVGEHELISIEKDIARYEFFTSEHFGDHSNGSFGWEQLPGPLTAATGPIVVGSLTRYTNRKPHPIMSHVLVPPNVDGVPKWVDRTNITRATAQSGPEELPFPNSRQRFAQHITWHDEAGSAYTISTAATPQQRGSMANQYSRHRFTRIQNQFVSTSDAGEDYPPTRVSQVADDPNSAEIKRVVRESTAPLLTESHAFWRHATSRYVDGVLFFICADNLGRFQIYKSLGEVADNNTYNSANTYWQGYPPYPGWVTKPSLTDWLQYNRCWHWSFSSDGKRAAAVAWNTTFSANLWNVDDGAGGFLGGYLGGWDATMIANLDPYYNDYVSPMREDTPGLVEFQIDINNTGPGVADFTVNITLLRSEYFSDNNRWFLNAEYSMPDRSKSGMATDADGRPIRLPTDTLLTAEVDVLVRPGDYAAGPLPSYTGDYASGVANGPNVTETYRNARVNLVFCSNNEFMERKVLRTFILADRVRGGEVSEADYMSPINYNYQGTASGVTDNTLVYFSLQASAAYTAAYNAANGTNFSVTYIAPYGQQRDWCGFPMNQPVTGGIPAYRLGYLHAYELRTLSARYARQDAVEGLYYIQLFAYNEPYYDTRLTDFSKPTPADFTTANIEPTIRVRSRRACIYWPGVAMSQTQWYGFSTHPHGHWAYSSGGNGAPLKYGPYYNDIIKPVGKRPLSHQDLFNAAFGQTRDNTFYTYNRTNNFQNDSSLILPKSIEDRGSFGLYGHWY